VIRGGHNIDPLPIEDILYRHPAVGLAAVVGQPDARVGELPVAYVQLKPDVKADADELLEFVRSRTPERAAVPVQVHLIQPMPLTGVGKVFKPELRWHAARQVFEQALSSVAGAGVSVSIKVGADPVHGSLATISIRGVAGENRGRIEAQVRERMTPYVMRYRIEWP